MQKKAAVGKWMECGVKREEERAGAEQMKEGTVGKYHKEEGKVEEDQKKRRGSG